MSQRRAKLAGVVVAGTLMLGACGFEAPAVTSTEHNSIQATDFRVGLVRVADTSITTPTDGGGGTPYLVVTIVNNATKPDTLTGVTTPGGTITLSGKGVVGGQLTLPPGVPVSIDQPALSATGPYLTVTPAKPLLVGAFLSVQFTFAVAGTSATAQVPVIPPVETTAATQPVPTGNPASPPPVSGPTSN